MSQFDGLQELSLDPDGSTSSWSMKYTLQDAMGRYLDLCVNEMTQNPKRARFITAQQATNIRRDFPELRSLKLRKGAGR